MNKKLDLMVEKLLKRAQKDLKATKLLYNNGLKELALNHLEQASEKILKAYFLGYIIYFLAFLYRAGERAKAYEIYRKIHQLVKQAVKNYSVPKKLGHDFDAFLNEFMPRLYENMCGGEFARYYEYSVKQGLIPLIKKRKNKIIGILVDEGLTEEQAEKLLDIAINYLLQAPGTLKDEETRTMLCKNDSAKKFGHALEVLRKSKEPCLKETVRFYKSILDAIERYYREEIPRNKTLVEDLERAKRAFEKLAEETGIELFKKYGKNIDSFMYSIIRGNMLVYVILPLHYCLVKYYEATRYPDVEIPEEILEKEYNEIPKALKILEEVHGIVKNLLEEALE